MGYWEKAKQKQAEYIEDRERQFIEWRIKKEADVSMESSKVLLQTEELSKETLNRWIYKYADKEGLGPGQVVQMVRATDMAELSKMAEYYVKQRWLKGDKVTPFTKVANAEMKQYNFAMRVSRYEFLLRQLNLVIMDGAIQQDDILRTFLLEMSLAEVKRQAGILGLNVQMHDQLRRNAELIVNADYHGQTFSRRIWNYQDLLQKKLDEGINRSIMLGQHPTKWSKALGEYMTEQFEGNKYAMNRLAITETGRVQIAVQKDCYERAGIKQYVVITEPGACPICLPFDNKVQDVQDMRPGINAPMFHPNCRCSTSSYVSREEFERDVEEYKEKKASKKKSCHESER